MPRRKHTAQNEFGFPNETPAFRVSEEELAALVIELGIRADRQAAFKSALESIGTEYLERCEQEKRKPTRAMRNAALQEILETSTALETQLRYLNYVAQDALVETLAESPFRQGEGDRESGWQQYESLRSRIEHTNQALLRRVETVKRDRGPERSEALRAACSELVQLYEQTTEKRFTHTAAQDGSYEGRPMSGGGRFVQEFLMLVDNTILPHTISSVLAELIKARRKGQS